ncbi:MAG: Gfo/Idh/MocA family oxidoreductase [Clostridiales bacterium]|nr:Gfo/Idh/MocA family oxidoreductase [Clostridiales bacterium]
MHNIKLGVVGLGTISAVYWKSLALAGGFTVSAVCDRDEDKLRAYKGEGVARYTSYAALAKDDGVDCVLIALPPSMHEEAALCCMRAGKSVLLEKPACDGYEQTEKLYDVAAKTGVLLRTAYHAAHGAETEWYLSHREEIGARYGLGNLIAAKCYFVDPYLAGGSVIESKKALGGSWTDSGVNALSVLARLVSLPEFSLCEQESKHIDDTDVWTHKTFRAAGVDAEIVTDWTSGLNKKRTELLFDSGAKIVLDHSAQSVVLCADARETQLFVYEREERLTAQYTAVFRDYHRAYMRKEWDKEKTLCIQKKLYE